MRDHPLDVAPVKVGILGLYDAFVSEVDRDENFIPMEQYQDYLISGKGRVTNAGCGAHSQFAPGVPNVETVFTCHRQTCPRCFRTWAFKIANKAAARIWAISERLYMKLHHSVFSPDPAEKWQGWKPLLDNVKKFHQKFHKKGMPPFGYSYVKHPYRIKCHVCKSECPSHDLTKDCPDCHSTDWWMIFSPHVHVVTNLFVKMEEARDYIDAHHFVYRGIRNLEDQEDVFKVLRYELGHAELRMANRQVKGSGGKGINYVGSLGRTCWHADYMDVASRRKDSRNQDYEIVKSWSVPDVKKIQFKGQFSFVKGRNYFFTNYQKMGTYLYDFMTIGQVRPHVRCKKYWEKNKYHFPDYFVPGVDKRHDPWLDRLSPRKRGKKAIIHKPRIPDPKSDYDTDIVQSHVVYGGFIETDRVDARPADGMLRDDEEEFDEFEGLTLKPELLTMEALIACKPIRKDEFARSVRVVDNPGIDTP